MCANDGSDPPRNSPSDPSEQPTQAYDPSAGTPAPSSEDGSAGDFGDYQLLAEIGRGGMGVVYRARQKSLDRIVAVKMILARTFASADQVQRFNREAQAAARLSHPNIVKVFDAGEVRGQHFFAMEHVRGRGLDAYIEEGTLDVQSTARLIRRVAEALDYLHRSGIVHRDIKPSNVLVDDEGQPYLTDFGVAKIFGAEEVTRTGVLLGTPSFMSPEQAAGRTNEVSPESDIYSLGAILYALLTGFPPFNAENPLDTLVQVVEREPATPRSFDREIPRDLELICLKCLEKAPQNRYPSAAALAEDLERFLAGQAVEARPPTVVRYVARWARREPPLALRLAAIGAFYAMELVNYYALELLERSFHLRVTLVTALWVVASVAFQQLLNRNRRTTAVIFVWGAADLLSVTWILFLANGVASPLVVIYPGLVAAAGLWLRSGFVWFITCASILSYLALVADFYRFRPHLQTLIDTAWGRHVYFVIMLLVIGAAVAYQVRRAQALSRYYASRRRPWRSSAD